MENRLSFISDHDHSPTALAAREELAERARRERRIEALSIDRSRFVGGIYHWSPEAEAADAPLKQIHEDTTLEARATAWRALFKLTL